MSPKTVLNCIALFLALCAISVVFFTSTPASADSGGFCQSNEVAKRAVAACENGYSDADKKRVGECDNLPAVNEKNACREGHTHRLSTDEAARTANGERCNVSGLGWIVCIVSKTIGLMVDGLFRVLQELLETSPLDQNRDGGRELYKIWGMFRNIANVIFVILFMTIIVSHVSSMGIGNYGIKRIMPRIVVGVLLINLSFIICGLVLDITNIIGSSLKAILDTATIPVKLQFSSWDSVVGVALVGAGALTVYLNVFAIAPIIFSGLVALLMTVVILVARHAIIVVLVIISPLAFALNILPSTQKWFNKWWSAFIILAMVYPVISFIFGATQVAAGVISAAAPNGSIGTLIFGTFALGVQSIPFFITPLLMKVGGGLLNRFAGVVNNPSKGLIDRGRKRVDQWSTNKTNVRETNALVGNNKGVHAAITRQRSRRQNVAENHKKQLSSRTSGAFGEFATAEENRKKLAERAARNTGSPWSAEGRAMQEGTAKRLEGELASASLALEVTNIDAAEATLIDQKYTMQELKDVINNNVHKDGSEVTDDEKAAAIKRLASQSGQDVDQIHSLMDLVAGMNDGGKGALALAAGIDESGVASSAAHLDRNTTTRMRQSVQNGENIQDSQHTIANAANRGVFNAERLSSQSAGTISKLAESRSLLDATTQTDIERSRDIINSRDKLRANQSTQARRNMQGF